MSLRGRELVHQLSYSIHYHISLRPSTKTFDFQISLQLLEFCSGSAFINKGKLYISDAEVVEREWIYDMQYTVTNFSSNGVIIISNSVKKPRKGRRDYTSR